MATNLTTIELLKDQLGDIPDIVIKAMFGEYGIWIEGKLVALVCEDTLFVKPTEATSALTSGFDQASPYPGAKPSLIVPNEKWEDKAWLGKLLVLTASGLPKPKPKKAKL
jgi:DNA transformation protein and related proteins